MMPISRWRGVVIEKLCGWMVLVGVLGCWVQVGHVRIGGFSEICESEGYKRLEEVMGS